MHHFVWISKYRHKVFVEPYRGDLEGMIGKIGYNDDRESVELEIPVDHIHVVVRADPKASPASIMQIIKSLSAREFFRVHAEIRRKYFWGGELWTQSYFVEPIGNASEEVIRQYVQYVQNQLKAMDKMEGEFEQLSFFVFYKYVISLSFSKN